MAEKPKKPQKLKARLPRGLEDRGPSAIAATRQMVEKIREVFERYGFEPVETPAMEYTDALGKFLPDQDRPNEGVFSFQDDDEQWISLRYDLTAPLARYVAENFDALPKPYRSYRAGYVYRNEKPGPGRFRQFMQFDADTVGSASPAADAEMCMMAADTMEALGIPRGSYVVKVNNRKVLDGVRDAIGIADDGQWLTVMRAIDKLDRLGIAGVRQLLGEGRKDESGDFTKGAGLNADDVALVVGALEAGAQMDARLRDSKIGQEGTAELTEISKLVAASGYASDRIADYQKMVAQLRNANIRAELYLGNPKNMGNQLKYADRRNSPCVIIQGSDEKSRGEIQIKDLIEGAKAAAAIASNQEWRETRPAQFSCKEGEIVAKVHEVLARHEVKWG